MITHPDSTLPEDALRGAYADLLFTLAREEPEALRRAADLMEADAVDHSGALPDGSSGARLARTWLVFTGDRPTSAAPEDARVFTFSYPAHLIFQVTSARGVAAARRLARRGITALIASEAPVGAIEGPLPASPGLSSLVVWPGSGDDDERDVLELEVID
ncbi:MAG TPA: hypothetical protein VF746_25380 [Longimicrobium sp.]|jgi:hypothetical protein